MHSSPACWAAFGAVLAREYSNSSFFDVHRLSVDSYAVQHPGNESRHAIQSVGLHLVRLYLFLECGLSPEHANQAMLDAGKHKSAFVWLDRPASLGNVTVKDVVLAQSVDEHRAAVHAWAHAVWDAWSPHRDIVRQWANGESWSPVKVTVQ
jgi:hypothetical protein